MRDVVCGEGGRCIDLVPVDSDVWRRHAVRTPVAAASMNDVTADATPWTRDSEIGIDQLKITDN